MGEARRLKPINDQKPIIVVRNDGKYPSPFHPPHANNLFHPVNRIHTRLPRNDTRRGAEHACQWAPALCCPSSSLRSRSNTRGTWSCDDEVVGSEPDGAGGVGEDLDESRGLHVAAMMVREDDDGGKAKGADADITWMRSSRLSCLMLFEEPSAVTTNASP
eukprot:CAMPEP_0167777482 /NCGR_PEP_ID=MMETSP0111_2-20121227/3728_1 /TAXON_ID=91324 /ORGANISM="Lotharella globosa, Strain CCCM811" /LENGTH=160 /DNA_ID=CAMNT_0007667691 /DNA_START=319 /DNA_END=798 /DNA_ORIENTATION=+